MYSISSFASKQTYNIWGCNRMPFPGINLQTETLRYSVTWIRTLLRSRTIYADVRPANSIKWKYFLQAARLITTSVLNVIITWVWLCKEEGVWPWGHFRWLPCSNLKWAIFTEGFKLGSKCKVLLITTFFGMGVKNGVDPHLVSNSNCVLRYWIVFHMIYLYNVYLSPCRRYCW